MIDYINNVVTPKSSVIDAASPSNASEFTDLMDSLTEKVMYGQLTATEAAEQLYEQGSEILAQE